MTDLSTTEISINSNSQMNERTNILVNKNQIKAYHIISIQPNEKKNSVLIFEVTKENIKNIYTHIHTGTT